MALGFQKIEVGSKQRVKILQACMVAGQALTAGKVYELPAEDAVVIKNLGKAEAVVEEAAPAAPVTEQVKKEEVAVAEEPVKGKKK